MLLKSLKKKILTCTHGFHLVDSSPWPIFTACAAWIFTSGFVSYLHSYKYSNMFVLFGLIAIIFCITCWWRDVIRESTFEGQHTQIVQTGLSFGMALFILSEVLFFFAFFWAFFHSSFAPIIELGTKWPPLGIFSLSAKYVPALNTGILLLSGCSVTWCHHTILKRFREEAIISLLLTVILAFIFTTLQIFEYWNADFDISDSIYGSTFYLATGFHGFHVLIGSIFLGICLIRLIKHHFTDNHHFAFEAAAWYWHFVDVVWLFLFISIYIWGNKA